VNDADRNVDWAMVAAIALALLSAALFAIVVYASS
jgi:hypothetical protein